MTPLVSPLGFIPDYLVWFCYCSLGFWNRVSYCPSLPQTETREVLNCLSALTVPPKYWDYRCVNTMPSLCDVLFLNTLSLGYASCPYTSQCACSVVTVSEPNCWEIWVGEQLRSSLCLGLLTVTWRMSTSSRFV